MGQRERLFNVVLRAVATEGLEAEVGEPLVPAETPGDHHHFIGMTTRKVAPQGIIEESASPYSIEEVLEDDFQAKGGEEALSERRERAVTFLIEAIEKYGVGTTLECRFTYGETDETLEILDIEADPIVADVDLPAPPRDDTDYEALAVTEAAAALRKAEEEAVAALLKAEAEAAAARVKAREEAEAAAALAKAEAAAGLARAEAEEKAILAASLEVLAQEAAEGTRGAKGRAAQDVNLDDWLFEDDESEDEGDSAPESDPQSLEAEYSADETQQESLDEDVAEESESDEPVVEADSESENEHSESEDEHSESEDEDSESEDEDSESEDEDSESEDEDSESEDEDSESEDEDSESEDEDPFLDEDSESADDEDAPKKPAPPILEVSEVDILAWLDEETLSDDEPDMTLTTGPLSQDES